MSGSPFTTAQETRLRELIEEVFDRKAAAAARAEAMRAAIWQPFELDEPDYPDLIERGVLNLRRMGLAEECFPQLLREAYPDMPEACLQEHLHGHLQQGGSAHSRPAPQVLEERFDA